MTQFLFEGNSTINRY